MHNVLREERTEVEHVTIWTQQSSKIDCKSPRLRGLAVYEISIMIDCKTIANIFIKLTVQIVQNTKDTCNIFPLQYFFLQFKIYGQKQIEHVKVEVKVHPRIGHEGTEGEQRYISTLSLTSALDGCPKYYDLQVLPRMILKHLSYYAQRETQFYPLLCVSKRFHSLKKEEILEEFV